MRMDWGVPDLNAEVKRNIRTMLHYGKWWVLQLALIMTCQMSDLSIVCPQKSMFYKAVVLGKRYFFVDTL